MSNSANIESYFMKGFYDNPISAFSFNCPHKDHIIYLRETLEQIKKVVHYYTKAHRYLESFTGIAVCYVLYLAYCSTERIDMTICMSGILLSIVRFVSELYENSLNRDFKRSIEGYLIRYNITEKIFHCFTLRAKYSGKRKSFAYNIMSTEKCCLINLHENFALLPPESIFNKEYIDTTEMIFHTQERFCREFIFACVLCWYYFWPRYK